MHKISEHEFLRDEKGNLTLLLDVISFDEADEPVFFVSKNSNTAYLHRSAGDVHQISNINDGILNDVRKAGSVVILELVGTEVSHKYLAPSSILDENEDYSAKA